MTDWRERARAAARTKAPAYILSAGEEDIAESAYLAGIKDAAKIAEAACDTCGSDASGHCPCHENAAAAIRASVKEAKP